MYLDGHGDVDLLCEDSQEIVRLLGAQTDRKDQYPYKGDGIHYYIYVGGERVSLDLRSVGDGYYCEMWEDNLYNQNIRFDFNSTMHKLNILGDINTIADKFPTDTFYLVTYDCPDETLEDLYDNLWLKSYAVALCKKQWAMNLMKYNGAPLAGGAELNHEGIMNEAKEELSALAEQLEDEFTLPPSFLVG